MARQEQQLEQKAKSGQAKPEELRGEQSAVKQGLDNAAQKLQQEGQKTSLLSGRSQRSVAEAQQKVSEAMQSTADARGSQQAASALGDAADALNRAASSLARDREKANTSSSATGFAEMMQQLQEMAKKQGSINAQAQGLMPGMGQPMSSQMQATSRALAREQRQVAQQLDELGEAAGGDRAAQLAKEAKQLAEALEGGRLDATTLARQQQLFRRMLDAGRTLEKDEREDTNKREAKSAKARQRAQARQHQRERSRRDEVPRADVGRAARIERRSAARDSRVLQADQCGNSVARGAGMRDGGRGNARGASRSGRRVRRSCRCRFPHPASPRPARKRRRRPPTRWRSTRRSISRRRGSTARRCRSFASALHTSAVVNALLGLERVYAELGWSDSLVAPLDTLIAANPREETYRTVQLRTLQSLGREAELRRAFDAWVHDMPNSVSPYREYARLLLQKNRAVAADSVLARAKVSARHDEGSAARDRASARRAGAVDRVGARVATGAAHRGLSRAGRGVRARADAVVGARSRFARSFSRCRSRCRRGARWPISR